MHAENASREGRLRTQFSKNSVDNYFREVLKHSGIKMHLLIVDDDSITRMTLRTILTSDGHTVSLAVDGEDALSKVLDSPVDMVITDVIMPRLNGIQLRNAVRSLPEKAHLPFLFISGYDDDRTLGAVSDPVKEGFFKKGRPLVELLAWIKYLTTPVEKRSSYPPNADCPPTTPNHRYKPHPERDTRPHL